MSEQPLQEIELPRSRFSLPPQLQDDPLPEGATVDSPRPGPSEGEPPGDGGPPRSRTGSSPAPSAGSGGRPRQVVQAELALAVGGALVVLAGIAGWLLRRPGLRLRQPEQADVKAVAEPVARIVTRHVPLDLAPGIALSIWDGCQAAGAAMAYANRGPLLQPHRNPEPTPEQERSADG